MLARCRDFCFDGEVGVLRLLFVDRMKMLPCLLDVWIRKEYFCSTFFFSVCSFLHMAWMGNEAVLFTQLGEANIDTDLQLWTLKYLVLCFGKTLNTFVFLFALWGNNWKYPTVYIWTATWPPTQIPSGSRKPSWVFVWLLYWPIPRTSTG